MSETTKWDYRCRKCGDFFTARLPSEHVCAADQPTREPEGAAPEELWSDLLPCPFCGAAAVQWLSEDAHWVGCETDDCCAAISGVFAAQAHEKWNRRAAPSAPVPAKEEPSRAELCAARDAARYQFSDALADFQRAAGGQSVLSSHRSRINLERAIDGMLRCEVALSAAPVAPTAEPVERAARAVDDVRPVLMQLVRDCGGDEDDATWAAALLDKALHAAAPVASPAPSDKPKCESCGAEMPDNAARFCDSSCDHQARGSV